MRSLSFVCRARVAAVTLTALCSLWCAMASADPQMPPEVLVEPPLEAPPEGAGHPGRLVFTLLLDATGAISESALVSVECPAALRGAYVRAALTHLARVVFRPATHAGQPIAARITYAVVFPDRSTESAAAPAQTDMPPSVPDPDADADPSQASSPSGAPSSSPSPSPSPSPLSAARRPPATLVDDDAAPSFGATATATQRRVNPNAASVSDVEIEVGALRAVPRRSAEELLTLAPGITLSNHGGFGHASALFLRGFDAGEGQDVETTLEGVPLNEPSNPHGHGYADAHFVIPELVRTVRVVEGAFDPRQGDFAVAGSVDYRTGLEERGFTAKAEYGSYAERRFVLAWAPAEARDGTFAAVELRAGDGFGPNRAHASVTAMARHEARLAEHLTLTLLAASNALRFDSAGVIRADDYARRRLPCATDARSQFFCTYDPQQGGSSSRHLLSARLAWSHARETVFAQLFAQLRHARFNDDFTGFLLDARGDGSEQRYDTTTVGMRSGVQLRRTWLGRPAELELGAFVRHDAGDTQMDRVRRADGVPYATVFDDGIDITNVGLYGAASFRPLRRLALRGGARLDAFSFGVERRDLATVDRTGERLSEQRLDAYGVAFSPRGTIDVAVMPGLSWLTSAGLGARSSEAIALSDGEFAPFARVVSAESGLLHSFLRPTASGPLSIVSRASAFYTYVERDLLFDPTRGRNVVSGASDRFGALVSSRLQWARTLDVLASVTYTDAYLRDPGSGALELASGPRLPFIPRWVARVDAAASHAFTAFGERFRGTVALGVTYVGPKPLPLGALSEPIFLLDASARLRWRERVEVALSAQNLLDARHHAMELSYVSNFTSPGAAPSMRPERTFAAGPPLQLLASLTIHVD